MSYGLGNIVYDLPVYADKCSVCPLKAGGGTQLQATVCEDLGATRTVGGQGQHHPDRLHCG